jgi:hypothetical protein
VSDDKTARILRDARLAEQLIREGRAELAPVVQDGRLLSVDLVGRAGLGLWLGHPHEWTPIRPDVPDLAERQRAEPAAVVTVRRDLDEPRWATDWLPLQQQGLRDTAARIAADQSGERERILREAVAVVYGGQPVAVAASERLYAELAASFDETYEPFVERVEPTAEDFFWGKVTYRAGYRLRRRAGEGGDGEA